MTAQTTPPPRPPSDQRPRSTRTPRWGAALSALLVVGATLLGGCAAAPDRIPTPAPGPSTTAGLTRTDVDAWLGGLVPAALQRSGIAGASVSVVQDGKILTSRGFGRADAGTGDAPATPVDPTRTLFRVGSVSKVPTATAVMQLVEQGRLDLDADVGTYLDFDLPAPRGTITLRHLLTHTAGFEEKIEGLIGSPEARPDLRTYLAEAPPEQVYAPGTTPAYSNYGMSLAGYVVERVSGEPFASYVEQHVLGRAGMTSSSYAQPLPEPLAGRLSQGYPDDAQPPVPFEIVGAAPAGSMSATADDMGRFMLAQLGTAGAGHSVLRPETLAEMHRPGLKADPLGVRGANPMALGLFVNDRNGHRILGHEGDTTVFHSAFEIYPDDGTGIFISLNGTGRGGSDAYDLRTAVTHGFTDRYYPGQPAATTPAPDASRQAQAAVGTYESSRASRSTFASIVRLTGQTQVRAEADGTLVITPGPEAFQPGRYEQVAPSVWREVGGDRTITMREADGRVVAIGYGGAFTLLRADAAHRTSAVLPVMVAAYAVLIISLIAWPVIMLLRRAYDGSGRPDPSSRLVRGLRRVGIAAAVLAAGGWVLVIRAVFGYAEVGPAAIYAVQAVQLVAALGILPAALHLVAVVRGRARWWMVLASILVLIALAAVAWFAVAYRLGLGFSVSY